MTCPLPKLCYSASAFLMMCLLAAQSEAAPVQLPSDLALVQKSNGNFISFRPSELLQSDLAKKMPPMMRRNMLRSLEEIEGKLAMKLADVERLTVVASLPMSEPVVLVRTTKPYDGEAVREQAAPGSVKTDHRGKTIYVTKRRFGDLAFCPVDAHVFVVGPPEQIRHTLDRADAKSDPLLTDAIALAAKGHHITLGTRPEMVLWVFMPIYGKNSRNRPATGKTEVGPAKEAEPDNEGGADAATPPEEGADPFQIAYLQPGVAPDREFRMPSLDELLDTMGPRVLPYKPLFQAKSVAVGVTLGQKTTVEWKLNYTDEAKAEDGENAMRTMLYVMREVLPSMWANEWDQEVGQSPQLFAFMTQVQAALKATPIERDGKHLSGKILLMVRPATLTAMFAEMEKKSVRINSSNNLKEIGIAMHKFLATKNAFPADAIQSKTGKPLLSWRVAILPFLDELELYRQFKLDEPWDSPHNKKLLAKMPKVYVNPTSESKVPYATHYRVFAGPGTLFDPNRVRQGVPTLGTRPGDITDGFSNSFLVVEAAEAVPWTKPEPLEYAPRKPLPKLGGLFPGGFNVLHADGAVYFYKMAIPEKDLRTLITIQDGVPLNWSKYMLNAPRRIRRFDDLSKSSDAPDEAKPDIEERVDRP